MSNIPPRNSLTVPVVLESYWHEVITQEEAFRRLAGRDLSAPQRARAESHIPKETQHYLVFSEGHLYEYVDLGEGYARVLLLLPAHAVQSDTWIVRIPLYGQENTDSGSMSSVIGIALHEFREGGDGRLYENGQLRDTFRLGAEPVSLMIDANFLQPPPPAMRRASEECLLLCEWVHSMLGIHYADFLCCFFQRG
jgi:hypothetical protein